MNINRDSKGCIEIPSSNNLSNINYMDSKSRVTKFEYKGNIYYFKKVTNEYNLYNELIAFMIASKLGVPCVKYDLARLDNKIGVVSKDFRKANDIFFPMEDILESEYGPFPVIYNNLEDIWYALSKRYDNDTVFNLMNQIISVFFFDVLIANGDRNVCNYGIIENEKGVSLGTLFDNEYMLSDSSVKYGIYSLAVLRDDYSYKLYDLKDEDNFLYKFLKVSDRGFIDLFESMLWVIGKENLMKIFSNIENNIGAYIPVGIKAWKLKKFMENEEMIKYTLNKVKVKKR